MTLYVLDTAIMGFVFQRHPTILQRLQHLPEDDLVVTTIIAFDEDLGGWLRPVAVLLMGWCGCGRMLVCIGACISTSNGVACRLTRLLPRSLISCAPKSSALVPMISLSPPSRWQSEVYWSYAIRLIFSVFLVLCRRTGQDHKPC